MTSSDCFHRGRAFVAALTLFLEMTLCGVFFLFMGLVLAVWEGVEKVGRK
jgi:hypothetical protein